MTERTLAQDVHMGGSADRVLGEPAFTEAMRLIREQIVSQWAATPTNAERDQLTCLLLIKLADKFEGTLRGLVASGRMAQSKIDLAEVRDEKPIRRFMRKVING